MEVFYYNAQGDENRLGNSVAVAVSSAPSCLPRPSSVRQEGEWEGGVLSCSFTYHPSLLPSPPNYRVFSLVFQTPKVETPCRSGFP